MVRVQLGCAPSSDIKILWNQTRSHYNYQSDKRDTTQQANENWPQAQETISGQVTTVFIFCESDWFEDTGKAFKN